MEAWIASIEGHFVLQDGRLEVLERDIQVLSNRFVEWKPKGQPSPNSGTS